MNNFFPGKYFESVKHWIYVMVIIDYSYALKNNNKCDRWKF